MSVLRFGAMVGMTAAIAAPLAMPVGGLAQTAPGNAQARAAGTCKIAGREESLGPTYVTYVGVSGGASCSQALRLVRSFYRCRVKHGGVSGHCNSLVEGFRCTEDRFAAITVQYDSRVDCTRGRERVRHDYTQFT